jgi:FKBP-type peptidyl-prolyl cis-trans isomerase
MKSALMAVTALAIMAAHGAEQDKTVFKDSKDKVSYSIGLNIGNTLKQQPFELNPEMVAAGVKDVLLGGKTLLTEAEVRDTLMAFQKDLETQRMAQGENNKKAGEAFLAENKKKPGVKTLASGLQYKVITEGKGKKPKPTDTVKTNYKGTLISGKEFDKSEEPVSFPVTGVIDGWTEALQLMPVGSKWQLFIPANLAYKEGGQGPIPPNSTLIFEIELLGIEEAPKPPK